ncbi:MAG: GtrA family protein [Clostridium sp.]|nr:GtrA family protein [Clostridium sp.]
MKIDLKLDFLFVKFVLVGILNTLFGYCAYAVLLFLGLHYSLAVILSTIAGVLFNFKTTGTLVFQNRNNGLIFKFFAVYAIICSINILLLKIAKIFAVNLYLAGFVTTCFMAVLSFLLNKNWVFKKNHEKN